ncbi:MAG: nicotinate-nucleotide adenylyltransferase [Citrobacter freundii]|nr:MAG: nicotinate-nucleotide adenylyltransferase [Citrobacter freundii]
MIKAAVLSFAILCASLTPLYAFSQDTLPGVTVMSRNYKYLNAVDSKEASQPVRLLEHMAAAYKLSESEIYNDDYDTYYISFYLPDGYLLAAYNADGSILYTAERFRDVDLPAAVRKAVLSKYPGWAIQRDLYLVKYNDEAGPKMIYKITVKARDKRVRIKVDQQGNFK